MPWLSGVVSSLLLFAALVYVVRLAGRFRFGDLSHAAMAAGMAAMFSPLGDPVPEAVWVAVFSVCAAVSLPGSFRGGYDGVEARHHLVGSLAMLFMLLGGHRHADPPLGAGLASVAALALAGYFIGYALWGVERIAALRVSTTAGATQLARSGLLSPTTAAAAGMVTALAMATMLLAMI